MTLCIAALCREDGLGPQRVVLGFDWKIETEGASAETEFKFDYVGDYWCALIAGPISQARELTDRYVTLLRDKERELTRLTVLDALREPIRDFRRSLADQHTHKHLAVSYEDFLRDGKNSFPPGLRRRIADEISEQEIASQIILVGLVERQFIIAIVSEGTVILDRDFAVIGSGTDIAQPSLFQREQHCMCSLSETVYVVYEAKRLGEIAPGVGKQTSIMILESGKDGKLIHQTASPEDLEFLDEEFKRFGPQKLEGVALPPNIATREQINKISREGR